MAAREFEKTRTRPKNGARQTGSDGSNAAVQVPKVADPNAVETAAGWFGMSPALTFWLLAAVAAAIPVIAVLVNASLRCLAATKAHQRSEHAANQEHMRRERLARKEHERRELAATQADKRATELVEKTHQLEMRRLDYQNELALRQATQSARIPLHTHVSREDHRKAVSEIWDSGKTLVNDALSGRLNNDEDLATFMQKAYRLRDIVNDKASHLNDELPLFIGYIGECMKIAHAWRNNSDANILDRAQRAYDEFLASVRGALQ